MIFLILGHTHAHQDYLNKYTTKFFTFLKLYFHYLSLLISNKLTVVIETQTSDDSREEKKNTDIELTTSKAYF